MKIKVNQLNKAVLLAMMATSSAGVLAASFQVNYQSIPVASMAWAGRASIAADASTIQGNPAGLSALQGNSATVGFAVVNPTNKISNSSATTTTASNVTTTNAGTADGNMVETGFVPNAFVALPSPVEGNFSAGLGVYGSFGFHADYEDTFKGINFANRTDIRVITAQPTISYKINDKISVGVGPTINNMYGRLSSGTPTSAKGAFEIKGDDYGYGFNVGVLAQPTDNLNVGLSYRSKVDYNLSGTTSFTKAGLGTDTGSGKLAVKLPDTADLSASYKITPNVRLHSTVSWTGWSSIDTLQINTSDLQLTAPSPAVAKLYGMANAGLAAPKEKLGYKDTWLYAIGAEYQATPTIKLRGGVSYDTAPTDISSSVRLPTGDRTAINTGLSYKATDDITFDFLLGYVREDKARVNANGTVIDTSAPNSPLNPSVATTNYSADHQNSYMLYGAQVNYKF